MNILFLYSRTSTYTNAVFEYLDAFSESKTNSWYFMPYDVRDELSIDLSGFDAICIHYSIRLAYDELSQKTKESLILYGGLKVIFLQDEYENTKNTWRWILELNADIIFTVVPEKSISIIYPPKIFPKTKFISCLTGYAPTPKDSYFDLPQPSQRDVVIGYRGRPLPLKYGSLGREKVAIGEIVKKYCEKTQTKNDIRWDEGGRIYGDSWREFLISCRAMLATESGSNVFDWDGDLEKKIEEFFKINPGLSEGCAYQVLIADKELNGLMNQISPKVFEAISSRSVLVLFEGGYSNVLIPFKHYIPLKKDGSNLAEVFHMLMNEKLVNKMADDAYRDIVLSGNFSYQKFVEMVDSELRNTFEFKSAKLKNISYDVDKFDGFDLRPKQYFKYSKKWNINFIYIEKNGFGRWYPRFLIDLWLQFPPSIKGWMKSLFKKIINPHV